MSTRRLASWPHLVALRLSFLLVVAGCGDATEVAPGPRFTLQPPIASMVVREQREVAVAWEGDVPADAQASWVIQPAAVARIVAASTLGATIEATSVGTALVRLTIASQGRATSRDMVLTVDPLACPTMFLVVSPSNVSVGIGGRVQVTARVPSPPCGPTDAGITFRVLDTLVATVDGQGWVTGQRIGTTALVVSSRENPALSATLSVAVVGAGGPPPSITVQPTQVDFAVGDTVRLRATLSAPPSAPRRG